MKKLNKTIMLCLMMALFAASPLARANSMHKNTDDSDTSSWSYQNSYWSKNYSARPYYKKSIDYSNIEPAYKYGYDSYSHYEGKPYSEVESDLESGWDKVKGKSKVAWNDAKEATHDAYQRMYDISHDKNND